MSGDVWASVLGQSPPQPPDGMGRGSMAFPDTNAQPGSAQEDNRHKLRDAIFVCRNTDLHASRMLRSGRHGQSEMFL